MPALTMMMIKQPLEPALLIDLGATALCALVAAFIWVTRRGTDDSQPSARSGAQPPD